MEFLSITGGSNLDIGYVSMKGKVRKRDEDSLMVMFGTTDSEEGKSERCLMVLADGMGGAQRGEKASKIAVDAFMRNARRLFSNGEENIFDILLESLDDANKDIVEYAKSKRINEMGTTVTAAFYDGEFLNAVNVGDSRTYLLSQDAPIVKTIDDSFVMELVLSGVITEDDARIHPRKNEIMRALGYEGDVSSPTYRWRVFRDDKILLCCDGFWEPFSEEMLLEAAYMPGAAQTVIENLAYLANEMDGSDNISGILCNPAQPMKFSNFINRPTHQGKKISGGSPKPGIMKNVG